MGAHTDSSLYRLEVWTLLVLVSGFFSRGHEVMLVLILNNLFIIGCCFCDILNSQGKCY